MIEKGPKGSIEAAIRVTEGTEKQQVVRYSDLDNLKIGPQEITGTVTEQVLEPEAEPRTRRPKSPFRRTRMGLENDNNALFNLLQKKGFTDVHGMPPPADGTA